MNPEPYGDRRQIFEALTRPHLHTLYRFAAGRVRNSHEAEDVVQEACLKAYRAFQQFEPGTDYRAWLFRILVNALADHRRKSARSVPMVPLEDFHQQNGAGPGLDACPISADPERHLLARAQVLAVWRAFDELPAECQTIIHLSVVEGFSYRQIAAILDCPIGTVMSRLYRSRRALADRLAKFLGSEMVPACTATRPTGGITPLARIREPLRRQPRERGGTTS